MNEPSSPLGARSTRRNIWAHLEEGSVRKQLLLNLSHSAPVQPAGLSFSVKQNFPSKPPLMDKPGFEPGFSLNLCVCLFLNWTTFPAAESPTSKKDVRALESPSSPNHSSTPCRQEHAESRNVLPLQKGKTWCVCVYKEPIPTWGTDSIPQRSAPALLGFELSFTKPGLPCELPLGCRPREWFCAEPFQTRSFSSLSH